MSRVKFHKLPHLTRNVTGQHYCPVLSDVSLPRLSEVEAAETQANETIAVSLFPRHLMPLLLAA